MDATCERCSFDQGLRGEGKGVEVVDVLHVRLRRDTGKGINSENQCGINL